jgi:hypothetical protein
MGFQLLPGVRLEIHPIQTIATVYKWYRSKRSKTLRGIFAASGFAMAFRAIDLTPIVWQAALASNNTDHILAAVIMLSLAMLAILLFGVLVTLIGFAQSAPPRQLAYQPHPISAVMANFAQPQSQPFLPEMTAITSKAQSAQISSTPFGNFDAGNRNGPISPSTPQPPVDLSKKPDTYLPSTNSYQADQPSIPLQKRLADGTLCGGFTLIWLKVYGAWCDARKKHIQLKREESPHTPVVPPELEKPVEKVIQMVIKHWPK